MQDLLQILPKKMLLICFIPKSNISRLESPNAEHLPNMGTLLEYAKAIGFSLEIHFRKNSYA